VHDAVHGCWRAPRVGLDAAARRVEDHYGVGVIGNAPSRTARAGRGDPGGGHPAG